MKKKRLGTQLVSLFSASALLLLSGCNGEPANPNGTTSNGEKTSATAASGTVSAPSPSAPQDTTGHSKGDTSTMKTNAANTSTQSKTSTVSTASPTGNPNVPPALTVGDANFKPGTYYKGYPTLEFRKDGDSVAYGTWWWYLHRLVAPDDNGVSVDMALDMLIANHISEIYLDIGAMVPWEAEEEQGGLTEEDDKNDLVSERVVRGFIKKCSKYGIRVSALGGSSEDAVVTWLDPKYNMIHMKNLVNKVAAYNANAAADERLYGVHLDVEPFTESQYGANRELRNQWTADLIIAARKECDRIGVELEWDIWAWTDAEKDMVTNQYGEKVNILDVYTRECHTLCIMAYTNTGAAQYERGTDLELQYAKKYGCRLIVASEMTKGSPASTTYYFSSLEQTLAEAKNLRALINQSGYVNKMGGAIHHIRSFWEYMTKNKK